MIQLVLIILILSNLFDIMYFLSQYINIGKRFNYYVTFIYSHVWKDFSFLKQLGITNLNNGGSHLVSKMEEMWKRSEIWRHFYTSLPEAIISCQEIGWHILALPWSYGSLLLDFAWVLKYPCQQTHRKNLSFLPIFRASKWHGTQVYYNVS